MENRKIISNYIYNIAYQLALIIIPIITLPYKSRILGSENIGIYSYVYSVYTYLLMIGTLGINTYGRREIAYVKENEHERSKLFFELLIFKIITIVITIITSCIFLNNSIYRKFYLIMGIDILFNIFDLTWFYQGMEEFKNLSKINFIIKITNVITIFLFVQSQNDLIIYFLITLIFDILYVMSLWVKIHEYITKVKIQKLKIIKHIKPCIYLFIPQVCVNIYTVCDKIMLGNIVKNINEVGFYENSNKIIKIALNIISGLVIIMIPVISQEFKKQDHEKIKKYMNMSINFVLFTSLPLMFGIIGISNNMVLLLFGEEYIKMTLLIKILSFISLPIGITSIIGEQYLVATKKEKKFTSIIMLGALTNIVLNFIFIPYLSSLGAAITTVITEMIILIIEIPIIKKILNKKESIFNFIKYFICSLLMFIIVISVGLIGNNWIILIMQVLLGIITYIALLFALKDRFVIEITNYLKKIQIVKKDVKK